MKQILQTTFSVFLFVLLVFFSLGVETVFAHHETPFSDVSSSHPNYTAIEYFRVRNMAKGYNDGDFHPGRRINRAEFIAMITRIIAVDPDEDEFKNCFSDVKKQWFADEVCYAKSEGWLDGLISGRLFRPSKKVSASEANKIATRAFDIYNINADNNFIGSLTRGDAAQMLYQVMLAAIQKGTYAAQSQYYTPTVGAINPYTVSLPPGYGTPWVPSGVSTQQYTPPVSSYSYSPPYSPPYLPPSPQSRVYAPYADMGLWPTFNMTQTANATGVKFYTMAFINSRGCDAAWFGIVSLNDSLANQIGTDINSLRMLGGDVIVSFGGATGIELANACSTVTELQAQYQRVITKYALRRIDFDIEGAAIADTAANDRRAQAIAGLQAANSNLDVSFTLPVLPTGLTQHGIDFLKNAAQRGVAFSTVNIMTFDYGSAYPGDMGDLAIAAAHATADQLASVYPNRTLSQRRAMIGVTPMFGKDDQQREFTQTDAQEVLVAAKAENWARLSGWGIHRDHFCTSANSLVCSGIAQQDFAFSNIFKQFP
ncbi:S-layer homology domain-containing protein [Candidatus Peregrinibacteria bacterium]|nr:S-layer homology domain-containing protein [Candidatus Peregrinibacteria bacterium]